MATHAGRANRIGEQIHRELSEIFAGDLADPRFESVTVTGVELSRDLGYARVRFLSSGDIPADTALERSLERAEGFFRSALAERLPLRRIPRLRFHFDRGSENVDRVETLLKRIAKRRNMFALLLWVGVGFWGAGAPSAEQEPVLERYEASFPAMGTRFTVAAYGSNRGFVASVAESAFDELRRADRMLSNYQPESELSLINRHAAEGPWKISEPMADLLARCLDYSRLSEGGFDMTVGPLMKAWGFFQDSGRKPSDREISRALGRVGYQLVELDPHQRTVRFLRPGVELDPGGVGKGYAVDRMAAVLREAGVERFFISAGDSSLYAGEAPPSQERGWRVRIRDGEDESAAGRELYLRNESLSTSGSYEKFFEVDGKRYSHLMNPRTGRPVEGMISVSVIAERTLDSEVWATALFVNGVEWARRRAPRGPRVMVCRESVPCEWINGTRDRNR